MFRILRWIRLSELLSSAPVDLESAPGRAIARRRAIAGTAVSSVATRVSSMAVTIISVPLTLEYLGPERFGMWMVLSSFTLLLGFVDLGVGNSTLNAVAANSKAHDATSLQSDISSSYAITILISVALSLFFLSVFGLVPWASVLNVKSDTAIAEAGPSALIFFIFIAITTPLNLVYKILLGLQLGFRASLWQTASNVLALGAIFVATRYEAPVPWLVLALNGTPALIALICTIHFFLCTRPDLKPKANLVDRSRMKPLMGGGILFLVLQICAAAMLQSNAIIIAQFISAEAVATFSIAERLFSIGTFVISLVLVPLWPAYGEALANKDLAWIKRAFRRSLIYATAFSALTSVVLILAGPAILRLWIGDAFAVPFLLLLSFGIWKVMETIGNTTAMLLNGLNMIGIQAIVALLSTISSIILKIYLVQQIGLPGVIFATIIGYGLFSLPWIVGAAKKILKSGVSYGRLGE